MNKELLYNKLYNWYEQNHRILPWRETTDPYCIWVSEIILQQTRVKQGLEYYMRFVDRFPNVQALANATEDEVLLYWQGLGYYSRARNMHRAAQWVTEHAGQIGGTNSDASAIMASLKAMPGVGEYTAGAIASFAFNLPYPALDGNVYRVLARLYDCDMVFDTSSGKKYFHHLAEQLMDHSNPRLFNSSIMEFGALYCVPNTPDCEYCPLQAFCTAFAHHTVELLPVRKPRTALRDRYLNYTIYISEKRETLLHQRNQNDIWKHLYEFPLQETQQLLPTKGTAIDLTHILSHQRLYARFHIEYVPTLPVIEDTIAVPLSTLGDYAFSRLTLKAIEKLLP